MLVWSGSPEALDALRTSLDALIAGEALAIACAGREGPHLFDDLIERLQYQGSVPHTMTRLLRGDFTEAVDDLLHGTWPCEERMDQWTGYWLVADGPEAATGLTRAARGLIDGPLA